MVGEAPPKQIHSRAYAAVVVQLGFIVILFATTAPFWIFIERPDQQGTKYVLGLAILAAILVTLAAGWFCGLSVDVVLRSSGSASVDGYVNTMAIADLVIIFLLVVVTGGVVGSSYIPLLLAVPALAMLIRASAVGLIVLIASGLFIVLVLLKIYQDTAVELLGPMSWLMSFKATSVPRAYDASVVLNLFANAWTMYLRYRLL